METKKVRELCNFLVDYPDKSISFEEKLGIFWIYLDLKVVKDEEVEQND